MVGITYTSLLVRLTESLPDLDCAVGGCPYSRSIHYFVRSVLCHSKTPKREDELA